MKEQAKCERLDCGNCLTAATKIRGKEKGLFQLLEPGIMRIGFHLLLDNIRV